jgi:hypothetical protein
VDDFSVSDEIKTDMPSQAPIKRKPESIINE